MNYTKRWIALWVSCSIASVGFADVPELKEERTEETTEEIQVVPTGSEGSAALRSSHTARSTNLQNWVFAGSALIVAAIGMTIVAINTGSDGSQSE